MTDFEPEAGRPVTRTPQFRIASLLVLTATVAVLSAIYVYARDIVVCTISATGIVAAILVWRFPRFGTAVALVVLVLGYGLGKMQLHQVIVGMTGNSYLFSVDDTGWTLAKLYGTSDPLLQYKTGRHRPDRWGATFNHPSKVNVIPGCLFRHRGDVWFFGVQHSLAIPLGLTFICLAHARRTFRRSIKRPARVGCRVNGLSLARSPS